MITAVADFLREKLSDNLAKLVQPAGLVPALIFVLLQVLVVVPELESRAVGPIVTFRDFSTTWQGVTAIALTFAVAYLLTSLTDTTLRFFSGAWFADVPLIGDIGRWTQELSAAEIQDRLVRLTTLGTNASEMEKDEARWERVVQVPAEGRPAPTALGNAFRVSDSWIMVRYGMNRRILWPYLRPLAEADQQITGRLQTESTTLELTLNLTLVLGIFAVEAALIGWWLETLTLARVGWIAACLILAYVIYRAAVGAALRWNEVMRLAFDRHRADLRTRVGLRPARGRRDEIASWKAFTTWLLSGTIPEDLFAGEPAEPPLTITASAGITTTEQHFLQDWWLAAAPAQRVTQVWRMEYVIFVAAEPLSGRRTMPADGAYLIVTDPSVDSIGAAPAADAAAWPPPTPRASIVATGRPRPAQSVLWRIQRLPARGSRALRYSVPAGRLDAGISDPTAQITRVDAPGAFRRLRRYTVELIAGAGVAGGAILVVSDTRLRASDRVQPRPALPLVILDPAGEPLDPQPQPELTTEDVAYAPLPAGPGFSLSWRLPAVPAGARIRLRFSVEE